MKRTIFVIASVLVVIAALIAVLVVRPVRTVKAQTGCSNRTLMGNYGWTESGTEFEYSPPQFWTQVALVHFDGNGIFTASEAYEILNGVASPDNGTGSASGTYTVNPNCTIQITYTYGEDTYYDHGLIVDAVGGEVIANEYGPQEGPDMTTGQVDIKKIWGSN
jgi:hypothetical protein